MLGVERDPDEIVLRRGREDARRWPGRGRARRAAATAAQQGRFGDHGALPSTAHPEPPHARPFPLCGQALIGRAHAQPADRPTSRAAGRLARPVRADQAARDEPGGVHRPVRAARRAGACRRWCSASPRSCASRSAPARAGALNQWYEADLDAQDAAHRQAAAAGRADGPADGAAFRRRAGGLFGDPDGGRRPIGWRPRCWPCRSCSTSSSTPCG